MHFRYKIVLFIKNAFYLLSFKTKWLVSFLVDIATVLHVIAKTVLSLIQRSRNREMYVLLICSTVLWHWSLLENVGYPWCWPAYLVPPYDYWITVVVPLLELFKPWLLHPSPIVVPEEYYPCQMDYYLHIVWANFTFIIGWQLIFFMIQTLDIVTSLLLFSMCHVVTNINVL